MISMNRLWLYIYTVPRDEIVLGCYEEQDFAGGCGLPRTLTKAGT